MKKIALISIIAASTGLLGNDMPKNTQPSHTNQSQQLNTTASIIATDIQLDSFSPQRGPRIPQTPANDRVVARMQDRFRRNMDNAQAARPTPVIIPTNNFATDQSDTRRAL